MPQPCECHRQVGILTSIMLGKPLLTQKIHQLLTVGADANLSCKSMKELLQKFLPEIAKLQGIATFYKQRVDHILERVTRVKLRERDLETSMRCWYVLGPLPKLTNSTGQSQCETSYY